MSEKTNIDIKTSYVSPMVLNEVIANNYLPLFIIRSIQNSDIIGKWSSSAIHLKELSPSFELFKEKRECNLNMLDYSKKFLIELCQLDLPRLVMKFEGLVEISKANGIVLFGYGANKDACHRVVVSSVLNNSGLFSRPITELML